MIIKYSDGQIDGVYLDKKDAIKEAKRKANIKKKEDEKENNSNEEDKYNNCSCDEY
jgi:hypothetical protein